MTGLLPSQLLTPEKALIFRLSHVANLPWLLTNGLHCANSPVRCPDFRRIGSDELIRKRATRIVPVDPGGVLDDYVPFYFTPWSVMLYNIVTGFNGIPRVERDNLVILVSSLRLLENYGLQFVFTDRHAYPKTADGHFYSSLTSLDEVDWRLLQSRDFRRDPSDPAKFDRYQAEALVHATAPIEVISGIACYSEAQAANVQEMVQVAGCAVNVVIRPEWFFP